MFTIIKTDIAMRGRCTLCGESDQVGNHLRIKCATREPHTPGTMTIVVHVEHAGMVCDHCAEQRRLFIQKD